jgi:UDP-glucose:(heptosyl)LPS alpha-1,3-glucosyltransferase
MRIAVGIMSLFRSGGLQRDCMEIARLVSGYGHDVTLFARHVEDDFKADGLTIVTLPNAARTNHSRQYQFATDFNRETAGRFDLTVGFDKLLGLDVLYCADPSKQIRLLREPYLNFLPRYRTYAEIEKSSFAIGRQTKTILLSQTQLIDYWEAWRTEPKRMFLLPPTLGAARRRPEYRDNGVRTAVRSALNLHDNDWVWLGSGVQPKTKGMDRAIQALPRFPQARLLLAGLNETDKAARQIARQAHQLGVADRVIWLGHREDIPEVMAAADLLLHPSRNDTTGTVILEAIVNGLPAIATAVCGYATHIKAAKAGAVIPEPFDQQFFEAVIQSARERALASEWSRAGSLYGQRAGLSEGRWCAAQIILAAAQEKHPKLADANAGLVPSDAEFQFDISTLQPSQDSDWTAFFKVSPLR